MINPESPFDGLDNQWNVHDRDGWWSLIIVLLAVVLVGLCVYSCSAQAHIQDRSDLDSWMLSLQSAGGYPCCSHVDGSVVANPDWDTTVIDGKSHYRVRVDGEWIVVTDEEVVEGPNRFSQPIVWIYRNADGRINVRCFLPGSGI